MKIKSPALRITACVFLLYASLRPLWAEDRAHEEKRVQASAEVLDEIMAAPDKGIPKAVTESAVCIGVVPSAKKGGFIVGAEYGKGVATCRTADGWSAPAPFEVVGGSWGLQIGGEAVDLVMLVMNQGGMEKLLSSKLKLGADASVAAGPVGRHAEGDTDWKLQAEVLAYSRAHGLFAGVTLNGAVVQQDGDATRAFYGRDTSFRAILQGNVSAPSGSEPFLAAVRKLAGHADAARVSEKKAESATVAP